MVLSSPTQALARQDLAATARERSRLYGLLAAVFRQEPGAELLAKIKTPDLAQALSDAGLDLGREFFEKAESDLHEELAIEYTRLFCGPGHHISPHESVQRKRGSGTLWGTETVVVMRTIEAAGFDFDCEFNGIPDHVSVELEFLAKLAGGEAVSWRELDYFGAENALRWQHQFIASHAGKWMPMFCRKVIEKAQLPFYAAFAAMLKQFLAGEKADIADRQMIASELLSEKTVLDVIRLSETSPDYL
ncbi:MAG: TorD/DmsD family molecular chaperone [Alphaproteobacteria bacterium]